MQWSSAQCEFAKALRDPERAVPGVIAKTMSAPSLKRFNVYRNNVAVSLSEALAAGYPVTRQLVGDDFFDAMARVFVVDNAPRSPVMLHYGDGFADFIAEFEPAQGLPFLADVARVEWVWSEAYNAADAEPVDISHLQAIDPEQVGAAILDLHPSLNLISSPWPAVSIWHIHQTHDDPAGAIQDLEPQAEQALIVRPQWDVDVRLIDQPTVKFIEALRAGETLEQAAEPLTQTGGGDLGQMLQLLFSAGCVAGLRPQQSD